MGKIKAIKLKLRILLFGIKKCAIKDGVIMGNDVRIMGGVDFGSEPYLIKIGAHVTISTAVDFITHDGGTWAFRDLSGYEDVIKYGKITIGNNTFIGAHSIIMPGVTIGERCVVGAGSIVTKSIPDGTVVCGVPAKPIMTTMEYAEKSKINMKPYDKTEYNKNKKGKLQ